MMGRPTVVVTGAGGFVAPWVIREFRASGYDVRGVDRARLIGGDQNENVRANLADPEAARLALSDLPESTVGIIHLAAYSHVGKSWDSPAAVFDANVTAAVNLFAAAAKVLPGRRFLFISSAEVYGRMNPEELPFDESTVPTPATPYGVSKLVAEHCLQSLAAHSELELVIARPTNHTGPGQSSQFAVPAFARRVAALERGDIDAIPHGNLETRRDFLDVRDVAHAYRAIFEHGECGQAYVVSSGRSWTMRSVLESLCRLAGVEPRLEASPALYRSTDILDVRGSSERLYALTGWEPPFQLEATLADVLAEAREQYVAR